MFLQVLGITVLCIYLVFNFLTAMMYTVEEMLKHFVVGQCKVGMVFANIFYAPAWFLKGLRFAIIHIVA